MWLNIAKGKREMPVEAREYLNTIIKAVEIPISLVSVGHSIAGEFLLSSLAGFYSSRFLHLFFVALAAYAIAYIRRL